MTDAEQNKKDAERDQKFQADFGLLLRNRKQAPLELLQTKYAKGYNKLVADVIDGADWFCNWYLNRGFPRHPLDPEGNAWLDKRMRGIIQDEQRPGGRFSRYRTALIDCLDMEEYENLVAEILIRLEQEAFYPYWMRHCFRRCGRIWNDIYSLWWKPKREGGTPGDGTGCWVDADGKAVTYEYPLREKATGREMPVCKGCGGPILWYQTADGKPMPCSPVPIMYWRRPGGTKKVLTMKAEIVSCEYEGDGKGEIGYIPHWAICPNRDDFRRTKGRK